ncbi:MAG: hypothetical protein ABIK65_11075 [Candidatus Eisenbacteria bacterium]
MKIRIYGNSIRLRLDGAELTELVEKGRVRRLIRFGPGDQATLAYSVETGDRGAPADADFRAGEIRLFVRAEEARRLEAGGEVSVEGERRIAGEAVLRVRIERDFAP